MLLTLALIALARALEPTPDPAAFLRSTYQITEYDSALSDLDNDGSDEVIILATGQGRCGSGGCSMFVLKPKGDGFEVVMESTVTNPPVWVLNAATNGWRDIVVTVSGGGGARPPSQARLRFDGHRYPSNPTVAPAEPVTSDLGGTEIFSGVVSIPVN